MYCVNKNSYLQLELAMDPRIINKAVRRAMRKKQIDPHDELPPAQRLESMQPSIFAPCTDMTRAQLGFERIGLRIVNRELMSEDPITQIQAVHTIMDQVQISESAVFLINLNVVHRLLDLVKHNNPIIREKVILSLIHLANIYQGRNRIMERPIIIDHIIEIFLNDHKEIRYVAALLLKTLTRDRVACEVIIKNERIVETLLEVIVNDHMGIVLFYLNSLKNLAELDPITPLKHHAFEVMRRLMKFHEYRIVTAAMDCMTQLCKHSVGQNFADKYDMTKLLQIPLFSPDIQVTISAAGLLEYTTLTMESKWRAKEFIFDLATRLVTLANAQTVPSLQIRAMQVLINLCECPDIRDHINNIWRDKIMDIKIRTHETWDGTSETSTFGLETGRNYRTMCIEGVETIKNDYDDNVNAVNVQSFLERVRHVKKQLIKSLDTIPDHGHYLLE